MTLSFCMRLWFVRWCSASSSIQLWSRGIAVTFRSIQIKVVLCSSSFLPSSTSQLPSLRYYSHRVVVEVSLWLALAYATIPSLGSTRYVRVSDILGIFNMHGLFPTWSSFSTRLQFLSVSVPISTRIKLLSLYRIQH